VQLRPGSPRGAKIATRTPADGRPGAALVSIAPAAARTATAAANVGRSLLTARIVAPLLSEGDAIRPSEEHPLDLQRIGEDDDVGR